MINIISAPLSIVNFIPLLYQITLQTKPSRRMYSQSNIFSTTALTPQPKGSIQFSTNIKTKQGTPKGTSTLNKQEELEGRPKISSVYDFGYNRGNQSLIFNTSENQIVTKCLSPNSKLDFKNKTLESIHKRNRSNLHDLSDFIKRPVTFISDDPSMFTNTSQSTIPLDRTTDTNPESRLNQDSPKRLFNLSKYKSVSKFGFSPPSHCKEDFQMGKKLGKGNFGDVFLVRHKSLGCLFALKIISKDVIRQKKMEKQIMWEATINMTLTHANITQMYGMFDDHENIYFIQELMIDGHLFNKIRQVKRLPEEEAAPILKGIIQGVDYMHRNSIIHRDLKPENILMIMGMYKIADFSWAIYTPDLLRDTFCGTPLYMSPEILKGEKYDDGVDNWALGILSYQLLVGKPPFKITSSEELSKIITEQIKFPEHINISANAKDFILQLLNKNPSERLDLDAMLQHPFIKASTPQIQPEFKRLLD